jgi:hypothetical protein
MIPMGEIDLQHEIQVGNERVAYRRHRSGHVRRMHSAKVEGRQSSMTVAIYQGLDAEEVCKFELFSISPVFPRNGDGTLQNIWRLGKLQAILWLLTLIRPTSSHPNIIQLHSAATSNSIHATVFHGGVSGNFQSLIPSLTIEADLISLEHFLDRYHNSPILTVYINACCVHSSSTSHFRNINFSAAN